MNNKVRAQNKVVETPAEKFMLRMVLLSVFSVWVWAHAQDLKLAVEPAQFVIIRGRVADGVAWKEAFGNWTERAMDHGILPVDFAQSTDTANVVLIGGVILDLAKAKSYLVSQEFHTDVAAAALDQNVGFRLVYCLDEIDDNSGNNYYMILTHKVKDYDLWRSKFFASEKERLTHGLKYIAITHDLDQPRVISVIFSIFDLAEAKDFVANKYLKGTMTGLADSPQVDYLRLEGDHPARAAITKGHKGSGTQKVYITANFDALCRIDDGEADTLIYGTMGMAYLGYGPHRVSFTALGQHRDSIRVSYRAFSDIGTGEVYGDIQSVVHKRVSMEKRGWDTAGAVENDAYSMVSIRGGTFQMGNDSLSSEMRSHKVTVKDFLISKYEVTQRQWRDIMNENPSHFAGCDDCPVENVSHQDAEVFIQKLNTKTSGKYRLPTEAEWEYAARGGGRSKGYIFSGSNSIDEVAWHDHNSDNETHPVGQKKANELGLYDMTGNVIEWCSDRFSYTYYTDGPSFDPHGPDQGIWRVLRGGSWNHGEKESLPAYRGKDEPTNRGRRTGIRLAADK